jgi:hypothetical protein
MFSLDENSIKSRLECLEHEKSAQVAGVGFIAASSEQVSVYRKREDGEH